MPRHNGYATFSECGKYRYELGGDIGRPQAELLSPVVAGRRVKIALWIMLNPSTADAQHDDPTIRNCVFFSEAWGYNRILIGNIYAFRATDPKVMIRAMKSGVDVEGPENNRTLAEMVRRTRLTDGIVMAAWGGDARRARVDVVQQIAGRLSCLRTNNDGSPVHPLYQPHNLTPTVWQGMLP